MHRMIEYLWKSFAIWIMIVWSEKTSGRSKKYIDNRFLYCFTWLWHFGQEISITGLLCSIGIQINLVSFLLFALLPSGISFQVVNLVYSITLLETLWVSVAIGVLEETLREANGILKIALFLVECIMCAAIFITGKPYILVFRDAPFLCTLMIGLVCLESFYGIFYVIKERKFDIVERKFNVADFDISNERKIKCIRETVDVREHCKEIESAKKHVKYEYLRGDIMKVNHMKRKNRIVIIAVLLCFIGAMSYFIWHFLSDNKSNVIIVQEKSYLREYEIINDEVHIYCVVTLYNQGDSTASVKLIGDFSQEVGLLADSELEAYFTDLSADYVTIESETSMDYVNIEFVGKYAGTSRMNSRNLPDIRVCNVEKSFGE